LTDSRTLLSILHLIIVSSVAVAGVVVDFDFFIITISFFAQHASLKSSLSLELRLMQLLISLLEVLVLVFNGQRGATSYHYGYLFALNLVRLHIFSATQPALSLLLVCNLTMQGLHFSKAAALSLLSQLVKPSKLRQTLDKVVMQGCALLKLGV